MRDEGIKLLENYPKCSQDLNPIEVAWRELRARLSQTEPARRETRGEFVARARRAVSWVNRNRADLLKRLCASQKQRARDVIAASGARTKN